MVAPRNQSRIQGHGSGQQWKLQGAEFFNITQHSLIWDQDGATSPPSPLPLGFGDAPAGVTGITPVLLQGAPFGLARGTWTLIGAQIVFSSSVGTSISLRLRITNATSGQITTTAAITVPEAGTALGGASWTPADEIVFQNDDLITPFVLDLDAIGNSRSFELGVDFYWRIQL